jgi:hypothetical protein
MLTTLKQVITNFLGSEKAMAAFVVLIAATIFTFTGKMSIAEWKEIALWVLGIYTAGKTVQGAASALVGKAVAAVIEPAKPTVHPAPLPTTTPASTPTTDKP